MGCTLQGMQYPRLWKERDILEKIFIKRLIHVSDGATGYKKAN